ncbi:MAG TPA: hypothetical protein VKG26_13615 [Bacteroidia bacterium]|nr:hypothetical protein [Bacteroidia bacterium]
MKNIFILLISLTFATVVNAQQDNKCNADYLHTAADVKDADPCVLTASNYILSTPLNENTKLNTQYITFILAWMTKTPDYTFTLNSKMVELSKGDENVLLLSVYMAALAKAGVTLKKDFDAEAIKLVVEYVSNPAYKVKQTSKVKKLIDSYKNNKIEKYIK